MKMLFTLMAAACVLASPATANPGGPTVSSSVLTVDNQFSLYLSLNDSTAGTLVGTGSDWQTAYSFSAPLTPGVTNYLHVFAENWTEPNYPYPVHDPQTNPAAFLGQFSVSNSYHFSNGGSTLLTGTTNWNVSTTGWGNWNGSLVSEGANGDSSTIWYRNHGGPIAGISSDALWIWTPDMWETPRYFSAAITPSNIDRPSPDVPEASTLMLALCGLTSMGGLRLRRK